MSLAETGAASQGKDLQLPSFKGSSKSGVLLGLQSTYLDTMHIFECCIL